MTIIATCTTLAAILASAQGGETINLTKGSVCSSVSISKTYSRQLTINAGRSTVRGLKITGGNVRWRSGRIEATGGAFGFAAGGYGIQLAGAQRVTIDGVLVTNAKKGIVIAGGAGVKILRSRFSGLGEDGMIVSRVTGLSVFANRFENTIGKPSQCNVAGAISFAVPQRDCLAQGGAWTDGTHADAVQMRDGVTDATISNNTVRGKTQGITQMDTTGDAPLARVLVSGNDIETDDYHRLTLGECVDCRIEGNRVRRAPGSAKRAVIIAGKAARCGNDVQDDKPDGAC